MINNHVLHLSKLDFGDNLRTIVCHDCGRSISIETDDNGFFKGETLKIESKGDPYATHNFSITPEGISLSISSTVVPDDEE